MDGVFLLEFQRNVSRRLNIKRFSGHRILRFCCILLYQKCIKEEKGEVV